jgi:hypothetical protein
VNSEPDLIGARLRARGAAELIYPVNASDCQHRAKATAVRAFSIGLRALEANSASTWGACWTAAGVAGARSRSVILQLPLNDARPRREAQKTYLHADSKR